MSDGFSRRDFLKKTAALTATMAVLPHARVLGANDDLRVAVVGFHNKGMQHIGSFKKLPGVRVVAICDVDPKIINDALEKHFKEGPKPETYTDIRKVIENKDIDVICVAMPNHWHALATIWACQAGKDVYVEKPASHSLWEGKQMIAAARKYNRVVQVGMQSRSDPGLQSAFQWIRDGNIGEIQYVRGIYYSMRKPIGKVDGPQQPPEGVDYDLWLGPAPKAPLMRKELHYDWHWQWPYGNGELGNNMVHMFDLATWLLDIKEFPARAMSVGARFLFDDDGETPNTQVVYLDMKPVPIIGEIRNLPRFKGDEVEDNISGQRVGVQVQCKDGYYVGYNTGGWVYDNNGKKVKQFPGEGGSAHHQNLVDAIRARKPEILRTDIAKGHLSAGLCHVGNASHRIGKPANGVEIKKAIEGLPYLEETIQKFHEHLLENGVDVTKTPRILGPWVTYDDATCSFTGENAAQANEFTTVPYQPGFEVPKEV